MDIDSPYLQPSFSLMFLFYYYFYSIMNNATHGLVGRWVFFLGS